jgi:hypothetical protein
MTEVLIAPVCSCCKFPLGVPRLVNWVDREGNWIGTALELAYLESEVDAGQRHARLFPQTPTNPHRLMRFETLTFERDLELA